MRAASDWPTPGERVEFVHARLSRPGAVLRRRGVRTGRRASLADLGVSSMQLDDPARGFSFRQAGPLDMRMDQSRGETLAERLAAVDETDAGRRDLPVRRGTPVAARGARASSRRAIAASCATPATLASVVRRAAGGGEWQRIDPATRTFQALRIWVNGELDGLDGVSRRRGRRRSRRADGWRSSRFTRSRIAIVKHTLRRLAADGAVRGW